MGYEWLDPRQDFDGVDLSDALDGNLADIIKREYRRMVPGIVRSTLRGATAGAIAGYVAQRAFNLPPDTVFAGSIVGITVDVVQYNIRYQYRVAKKFFE
jgi:hypothetical protein